MCVLVICFTLFEVPFPLDDNFLFLYFKVRFQCIEQFHAFPLFLAHSAVGWRELYKLPGPSLAFNGDRSGKAEDSSTNFTSTFPQFALTPLLTKVIKLSTPLIGVLSAASKASYYIIIANTKSRTMVSSPPKFSEWSLTPKCFQTYLATLACLEGGVGNIVSRLD